jgi:hypothetical protein
MKRSATPLRLHRAEYSRGEVILAPGDKQGGGGGPGRRGTGLWIVVYGLVRASFSGGRRSAVPLAVPLQYRLQCSSRDRL